jgi:hypothetical protein
MDATGTMAITFADTAWRVTFFAAPDRDLHADTLGIVPLFRDALATGERHHREWEDACVFDERSLPRSRAG